MRSALGPDVPFAVTDWRLASGATPLHILRPIFLRPQDLLDLQPRVIEIMLENADTYPPSPVLASWSRDAGPELRVAFRRSLKQHLFGCNVLLSLRLRLSVADFCWASCVVNRSFLLSHPDLLQRNTTDPSKRDEYSLVAQQFLRTISFISLRILCRHFLAVVTCLQGNRCG